MSSPKRQVASVEQLNLDLLGLTTKHAVRVPCRERRAVGTGHHDRPVIIVDDVEHEPRGSNGEVQHFSVATRASTIVVVPAFPPVGDEATPVASAVVVNDEVPRGHGSDTTEDVPTTDSEPVEVLRERHVDVASQVLVDELGDVAGHDDSLNLEDE